MKLLCSVFVLVALPAAAQAVHGRARIVLPPPPPAEAVPAATTFLGTRVVDNYRWLENGSSAATQEFLRAQNAYAARYLEQARQRIETLDDLADLENISTMSVPIARGEALFYTKRLAGEPQASLYVRRPARAAGKPAALAEKRLLDPAAISPDPDLWLRVEDVARDGSRVAFSLVSAATGEATVRVADAASGKLLEDQLPLDRYRSVAFAPDGTAFYYARQTPQGTLLYLHRLGTRPSQDTLAFGREFHGEELGPDDPFTARVSDDGRYLVVTIERGQPARRTDPAHRTDIVFRDLSQAAHPFDVLVWELEAHFSALWAAGAWYVETDYQAERGRIFKADPGVMPEAWEPVVVEGADPIADWTIAGGRLLVTRVHAGKPERSLLTLAGKPLLPVDDLGIGSSSPVAGSAQERSAWFSFSSPLAPPALYRLDTATGRAELFYQPRSSFPSADFAMRQLECKAGDDSELPILVVGKKNLPQDGSQRLLLLPLGGFGAPSTPAWSALAAWWLQQGGWLALATIRGGGATGIDFQQGAERDWRQQGVGDWLAAAHFLVAQRYSAANRMALLATTPGSLLAGATLASHPEAFAAVAATNPVFDPLRPFLLPAHGGGMEKTFQKAELEQKRALFSESPYRILQPSAQFPAVFLVSRQADGIDPSDARKATALLQAGAGPTRPALLWSGRNEDRAGAAGWELELELEADRAAFLWIETGEKSLFR